MFVSTFPPPTLSLISASGKLKFNFVGSEPSSQPFITLLQGRTNEIILRDPNQLQYIADAAEEALLLPGCNTEQLEQLRKIIEKKKSTNGTKAQLKPAFSDDGVCEKVAVVVKWGGEASSSVLCARVDADEALSLSSLMLRGTNLATLARTCARVRRSVRLRFLRLTLFLADYVIMNKSLLDHTHVYSSSERRVVATAEIFSSSVTSSLQFDPPSHLPAYSAFLDDRGDSGGKVHQLTIRKDLLDDSNAAKHEVRRASLTPRDPHSFPCFLPDGERQEEAQVPLPSWTSRATWIRVASCRRGAVRGQSRIKPRQIGS